MSTNLSVRPSDEVLQQNWVLLCKGWNGSVYGKVLGMAMYSGQEAFVKSNGLLKTKVKFEVMPRHVVGFINRANSVELLTAALTSHRSKYNELAKKRAWKESSVNARNAIYDAIATDLTTGLKGIVQLESTLRTISAHKPILGLGNHRSLSIVDTVTEIVANRPTPREYAKRVADMGLGMVVDQIAPEEFDAAPASAPVAAAPIAPVTPVATPKVKKPRKVRTPELIAA